MPKLLQYLSRGHWSEGPSNKSARHQLSSLPVDWPEKGPNFVFTTTWPKSQQAAQAQNGAQEVTFDPLTQFGSPMARRLWWIRGSHLKATGPMRRQWGLLQRQLGARDPSSWHANGAQLIYGQNQKTKEAGPYLEKERKHTTCYFLNIIYIYI